MKILSLYIDKWYIVGAVIDGANKTPLYLSNAEDRIWLYFYSNSTSNAVKYSRRYRDDALAGKKGYYEDVFDLLPDYKEFRYEKYTSRKEMKHIFSDSGILNDLRKTFGSQPEIPVYLSFSKDIDIVSQHIFIKALEDDHYQVLQFTKPIENLALEHLERRKSKIAEGGNVLVVNACNENLQYSVFKKEDGKVTLLSQRCERGYGVDSRIQAIVEEVLEYLQADTHFLTGDQEERHEEMLYLSQFAEKWLRIIDDSPSHAPVALGNIHFKKQAQNDVPVVVSNDCINDRTKNIIDKLTRKIVEMIKEKNILLPDISHIVFLGDVFSNNTFVSSLQKKIGVNKNQIVKFEESMLPEIVGIYNVLEKKDFEQEKSEHITAAKKKYEQDRQKAVEQKTAELKAKALVAEDEGRLQEAIDYYSNVLLMDPNDQHSKGKIPFLEGQLAQLEKDRETVNELIEKARQNFIANKYKEAIENCEEILRLQNDNVDAQKIKEETEKVIKRQRQLDVYIKKMEKLLDEDKYFDARNTLQIVDAKYLNDVRLKSIRERINSGIALLETQVMEKTAEYESAYREQDYQTCLRLCDDLLIIGADSTVWRKQKKIVQDLLHEEELFQEDYKLAQQARQRNQWAEVIEYANKALSIKENDDLRDWIAEADRIIQNQVTDRIQEEFIMAFTHEEWLKVIELYDANEFLHLKSTNSDIYLKTKRILRKIGNRSTSIYTIHVDKAEQIEKTNVDKERKSEDDERIKTRKNRFGPTRPTIVNRPTQNDTSAPTNENTSNKKNMSSVRPHVYRPNRVLKNDNSSSKESVQENASNKKNMPSVRPHVYRPSRYLNTENLSSEKLENKTATKKTIINNHIFNKPKR